MKQLLVITLAITLAAISACERSPSDRSAPGMEQPVDALPYAVGSSTSFIHDDARGYDRVAGVDAGIRTMVTEIWYPVDHETVTGDAGYRRATYGDYVFGNRDMHRRMMTQTTFFHLTPDTVREGVSAEQIDTAIDELFERERSSYVDAPPASTPARMPVVVMSHGDAGSRYNMESVCEYLAGYGYFVIAPEHTGNSPYSMTGSDPALADDGGDPIMAQKMAPVLALLDEHGAYGVLENWGQSYTPLAAGRDSAEFLRDLDHSLLQRLNDLRATLDELAWRNDFGRFAGRLDLDRIGLMGRSFGGASTIMGLAMEPRFAAGFSVVPPGWADPRPALPADMLAPAGEESVLLAATGPFPLLTLDKPTMILSGAEDGLIIGLGAQMGATPMPGNPHPILRRAFETSEAPVVWGVLADSNHATFGVSGSYWWPDLKPAVQERYFSPGEEFTLVAPAVAHRMQRELALAFFNLTIRGNERAKAILLDERFRDDGLLLEWRNID